MTPCGAHAPRHAAARRPDRGLGLDVLPHPRPRRDRPAGRLPRGALHPLRRRHARRLLATGARASSRRQVLVGVGLGALYGLAQIFQTQGLATTPASVSGFITGTYVVLTPVFTAVLLRERVPDRPGPRSGSRPSASALLSLNGLSVGVGEAITLLAAALYALHIVGLGRYSASEIATGLSVVQMVVIAVLCVVGGPARRRRPAEHPGQWATVLYMVVFASILALWVQTWAQAHMPATRAAIIMTLEPVFAAFFAVTLGDETATLRMVLGGALVLTAMYAVELLARRRPGELPAEALHHEV